MSLLDEVRDDETHHRQGVSCWVTRLRASDPDLAAEVEEAMAAKVRPASLTRVLNNRGIDVGGNMISRHIRGECKSCRPS
jgi:hypothetical protein